MRVVTIEELIKGSEQRLGLISVRGSAGSRRQTDQAQVQFLEGEPSAELLPGIILIIAASVRSQWTQRYGAPLQSLLDKITAAQIPAIFLSETPRIPWFLNHFCEEKGIPIFASRQDEFLLESRLKGLLREKIDQIRYLHGALVNVFGRGVLIRGESGIGKTTLALELADRGHRWVADDAIEIEKRDGNRLWARGCRETHHLVDLKAGGIRNAADVVDRGKIQDETMLHVVIEGVFGKPLPPPSLNNIKTCAIMNVEMPCFEMIFSDRGPMDASRIEKSVLRQRGLQ